MAQQELTSAELFGIAKKFNSELEQFPMHSHSAIVEMVRVGMQHRNLAMQDADRREANDRQERALKIQENHLQNQKHEEDKAAIRAIGLVPPN